MTTENLNDGTTQTPAAAPAAAAPAPNPAPVLDPAAVAMPEPTEPEVEVYEYEPSGNPAIDIALEFVGQRGIKETDPEVVAARAGDFSKIEAKLAGMGDKAKGWERNLALVKAEYRRETERAEATRAKTQSILDNAVGGNERWNQIAKWAGVEASPDQKAEINAALNTGGLAASSVARELARMFDAKVGTKGASATKGDTAAPTISAEPLTAAAYGKAVAELQSRHPTKDVTKSAQYAELRQRRLAARSAGL